MLPFLLDLFSLTQTCLLERCGYTDMIVMTDDDGVEEKYQPTDINLVRLNLAIDSYTLTTPSSRNAKSRLYATEYSQGTVVSSIVRTFLPPIHHHRR